MANRAPRKATDPLRASKGDGTERSGDPAFQAPQESYDYVAAMKRVAAKFKGKPGVYLHLGDDLTYTSAATHWARSGQGQTVEERAFLRWSHAGEKNDADGWHLASVDMPLDRSQDKRSCTAALGVRADEYLTGGRYGLPALAEIVKTYNPQLALYLLGFNDIRAGRPVADYRADVEKAIDSLLDNGTVVILATLPPYRDKAKEVKEYNAALRRLAQSKHVPLLDLYAEIKARAGEDGNGLDLTNNIQSYRLSLGPPAAENLKKSGYLLRCYLAVRKGMEVKAIVLDAK